MNGSAPLQPVNGFDPKDPFFSVSVVTPFHKGERDHSARSGRRFESVNVMPGAGS